MNNLIKLELRNILKQKSFLICLIISNALVIIGILASNLLNEMAKQAGVKDALLGVNAFDTLLGYLQGGNITLLLAIVISIYFGASHSEGTIKNIIAKGYTRKDFFIAKIIGAIIATLIFIITAIFFNYIMCFIMRINIETFSLIHLSKLGCITIAIIAETIMFSSLSFIIFKTGANIVANICIPLLFPLALTLIDVLAKTKIKISDFWIENTYSLVSNNSKLLFVLIVSIVYIIIFSILGITLTKRKEIK